MARTTTSPEFSSDADLHRRGPASAAAPRRTRQRSRASHGGAARADGVIFVRERRAEQRHDAVAHHLVHRAFVAMHGFHHPLEDGIEEPPLRDRGRRAAPSSP
jgi:hypothetical protein